MLEPTCALLDANRDTNEANVPRRTRKPRESITVAPGVKRKDWSETTLHVSHTRRGVLGVTDPAHFVDFEYA